MNDFTTPTRGERNNNPGNLDFIGHTPFIGQIGTETAPEGDDYAPRFGLYDTMFHGVRALAEQLIIDQQSHSCRTASDFVLRWAPMNENATGSYIAAVTKWLDLGPAGAFVILDLKDMGTLMALVVAIIHQENGRCLIDHKTILDACGSAQTARGIHA